MGRATDIGRRLAQLRPSPGAGHRIGAIASFEIGRQVRHAGFWAATGLLFATGLLLIGADSILGSPVLARNAPVELAKGTLILSIFFLLGAVAMAADAALRDSLSGFEPILRATPQTRAESIVGRFLGLQVTAILSFTLAASGLLAGALMPWVDQKSIGPFIWPQIALIWLLIGAPTVIALTSISFALAAALRSAFAAYVVVIVALVLAVALPRMIGQMDRDWLIRATWVEPFGLLGFMVDTAKWTIERKAVEGVPLGGLFMANRACVLTASGVLLILAMVAERRSDETRLRQARPDPQQPVLAAPQTWRNTPPSFGFRTSLRQFASRLRLEVANILLRPSLLILAGLILMFGTITLWTANSFYGTPSLPAIRVLAEELRVWFLLLALLVAIFFGGETIWRERDYKVADLIDATPTTDLVFMSAKIIAVFCAILVMGVACIASAICVQLAKGYVDPHPSQYLTMVILPVLQEISFPAMLALTGAVLAPNRFVGWLVPILSIAALFAADWFGFSHPLFDFSAIPSAPLSEMNPQAGDAKARAWVATYWLLWSGLLFVFLWMFWPRGQSRSFKVGLRQAQSRLHGLGGVVTAGLMALTVAVGGWILLNTVIWNPFVPSQILQARQAQFERETIHLLRVPAPSIIDTRISVSLWPRLRRMEAKGQLILENQTATPLSQFYVHSPDDLSEASVSVPGAREVANRHGLRTFVLDKPLNPGGRTSLTFRSLIAQKGSFSAGFQIRVARNGTFLRSDAFIPTLGVNPHAYLQDPDARKRQHLPPSTPTIEPNDPRAGDRNYLRADWSTADITITTDSDQTPVAPGRQVSEQVKDGRRVARFVSDRPILSWFSIQSARYAVRKIRRDDVDIAVYFHPGHGQNVDRMLAALEGGLAIYEKEFGPYPLPYLRIVEFPAYGDYAQAFAGTIPFSENVGFITDLRNPKSFDYVTKVTLHELAHQWWGHQVIGGDARGARLMSEGLSEYSATMAQGRLQGPDAATRALKISITSYLERQGERRQIEPAPYRENSEPYIAYDRANISFAYARQFMGEAELHRALRAFLHAHAFQGAPYPTSLDLFAQLQAEATPVQRTRLKPLFLEVHPWFPPKYLDASKTGDWEQRQRR